MVATVLLLFVILVFMKGNSGAIGAVPDRARCLHGGELLHRQVGLRAPPAQESQRRQGADAVSPPDVRSFTVGPVQENCHIVRADAQADRAVIVDPGDEPERLLEAAQALGVEIEAILLTHCHFDHIGAVAPVARATGAPVYCPKIERAAADRRDALGAARLRSVRELRARAHARRRRAPEPRRAWTSR